MGDLLHSVHQAHQGGYTYLECRGCGGRWDLESGDIAAEIAALETYPCGTRAPDPETPVADPVDLPELRRLAEAATPGPWGWRGNDDGLVELRGRGPFGPVDGRVVSTLRARPCIVTLDDRSLALTFDACDSCRAKWAEVGRTRNGDLWENYTCPRPENLATIWLCDREAGFVRPSNHWAVREQPYRTEVVDVDHADARYLASLSPDVVLALLARIDALEAGLEQVGWNRPGLASSSWPQGPFFVLSDDPHEHEEDVATPGLEPVYRLADPGAVAGEQR